MTRTSWQDSPRPGAQAKHNRPQQTQAESLNGCVRRIANPPTLHLPMGRSGRLRTGSRLHNKGLHSTTEPELPEPEAIRHSFDGYGYLYTDSGSGSLWKERAGCMPDAEPIYTAAQMHEHYAAGVRAGAAGSPGNRLTVLLKTVRKYSRIQMTDTSTRLYVSAWGDGAWWPDVWESPAGFAESDSLDATINTTEECGGDLNDHRTRLQARSTCA